MVELKRICRGTCKKFRVTKPKGMGRYEAGQGHCQMCDMWIDHRGAHTKSGTAISLDSDGWFCNCCNYRVRRKPRNIEYKMKLRGSDITQNTNIEDESDGVTIDLSYFSKQRAAIMKSIAICILKETSPTKIENYLFDNFSISKLDIEIEFNISLDEIIKLAHVLDPPNKMSMILEFERIKSLIGVVPTKMEFEENSMINSAIYETEFRSWEHMLERLGYDPWYRDKRKPPSDKIKHSDVSTSDADLKDDDGMDMSTLLENLRHLMDSETLRLFNILDEEVKSLTKEQIKKLIQSQF